MEGQLDSGRRLCDSDCSQWFDGWLCEINTPGITSSRNNVANNLNAELGPCMVTCVRRSRKLIFMRENVGSWNELQSRVVYCFVQRATTHVEMVKIELGSYIKYINHTTQNLCIRRPCSDHIDGLMQDRRSSRAPTRSTVAVWNTTENHAYNQQSYHNLS